MSAQIIDGKMVAEKVRELVGLRVRKLAEKGSIPGLAVILVGENPGSLSYVNSKEKDCAGAGIRSFDNRLPESTTEEELIELVQRFNKDPGVHGILVQLPLPKHIDENRVIAAIDPEKDADGFHPINVGKMLLGQKCFLPCTPHGVLRMLDWYKLPTKGAHAVVVGRSNIVGKPLAGLLFQRDRNATVTLCHTATKDLSFYTRQADILIAAVGSPELIRGDMIKPGAIVIDVGMNRVDDPKAKKGYRNVGDVNYSEAFEVASFITPVPGGVGPMTRAMLLENTVLSAELHFEKGR